jgi:hypothetical protein
MRAYAWIQIRKSLPHAPVTWRIPQKREGLKTETENVFVSDSVAQSPGVLDLSGVRSLENGERMVQLGGQWAEKYD